jgi:flagellar biosynthesis/type III secretory pathway protein FliH
MVLTEFNEEVYKKGIYEEGYSEGVNDGKAQGIAQGQSELADAIKRIHSGATVDDLIKAGFDKETAELAWSCR